MTSRRRHETLATRHGISPTHLSAEDRHMTPREMVYERLSDERGSYIAVRMKHEQTVFVDESDWAWFCQFNWYVVRNKKTWYCERRRSIDEPNLPRCVRLHRALLEFPINTVDHRDGYGLNCRRYNLREATAHQNAQNLTRAKENASGYRGVFRNQKDSGQYRATITVNRQFITIGSFDTPEEAALAYDAAVIKYRGEFAVTNASLGKI